jgi:hypothetical protein
MSIKRREFLAAGLGLTVASVGTPFAQGGGGAGSDRARGGGDAGARGRGAVPTKTGT